MEGRLALLIFGLCGLAGILVDADHLVALVWWQYIDHSLSEGRIFHPYLFLASSIILCCVVSYLGRYALKLVLRRLVDGRNK